jgi:hypothetical protein
MKELFLYHKTSPKVALVDDEDFYWLNEWNWYPVLIKGNWYARRSGKKLKNGHQIQKFLHRVIMRETDPKILIHHKNHNGLDCQKYNLVKCSHAENNRHKISQPGSSSKYLGVSWDKSRQKWNAQLTLNRKSVLSKRFDKEEDAAEAYDKSAIIHFGEFANLNFKN